jgi:hypothetical protein
MSRGLLQQAWSAWDTLHCRPAQCVGTPLLTSMQGAQAMLSNTQCKPMSQDLP